MTEEDAIKLRGRISQRGPWVMVSIEPVWLTPKEEHVRAFLEQRPGGK
jgi:hypothetical protein